MSSDPVPVNKASKFDESKVKRSKSGQFSSTGGGARGKSSDKGSDRGSAGGDTGGGSAPVLQSAFDVAGRDLTISANRQHKKKLDKGRAMQAWAERKAAERKAAKEGKSAGGGNSGKPAEKPAKSDSAAAGTIASGRGELKRTDPLIMGRPGGNASPTPKPPTPPSKAEGFRAPATGPAKAVIAKPSGPTTITPEQRKSLTITTTAKVLENRGYRLGRAYIGGGKNGFKASYDVHGPKGEKYRVDAKSLGDWLMKKPADAGPPPQVAKTQAKASPAPKAPSPAARKASSKPAAPPKKVTGPIGPAPAAKTPSQAIVSQAKKPASPTPNANAGGSPAKSSPAKPAKPAGKVTGPIRRSDEIVDAQLVTDGTKKPPAPPKKVTGPISAAGTAGNPLQAEMVIDGANAPKQPGNASSSSKSQPASRRLRPGLRRGPAVLAQSPKPSHHQVAMGSRRIANVIGLPHQPGPGGSRIVGGGLSQVHAALKDAGFAAVQAFRTRMGPVVDYHSAARGVTARVMRSAGRTGRTAIRLLGEVTGLRKDAGMDFQSELRKSAMDTLIALAGSPGDLNQPKPRCPRCGSMDVSSHDKKATMWQCSTDVEKGCGHRWDGNAKTGMPISKSADMPLGCAMVRLPQPLVDAVVRMQSSISPADVIGWEDTPHVTLRYGVRANADQLSDALRDVKSITFTLGGFDIFVNDEQEVLFVRAIDDAGELASARKKIEDGCMCDADMHPEYVPHVTIAYLKPGTAMKYLELDNPLGDVKVTSYAISYQTKAMVGLLKSAATGEPISNEAAKSPDAGDEAESIMPMDAEHKTHRHGLKSASWMGEGDDGGHSVSSTIVAAEKAGFEQSSRKVSRHQDGSMMTVKEVYLHPDGHKLTVNREIMESDMPAFHSMMLTSKPGSDANSASDKPPRKKSSRKLTKCSDAPWDCEAARGRLELWASDGEAFDLNNATHRQRFGQGFAAVVGDGTSRADYLYPHHDVVAGSLVVNRSATLAAMGALSGATDASGAAPLTKSDVSAVLEHLRRDIELTTEG